MGVEGFLWWGRVWDFLWFGDLVLGGFFWVGFVVNLLEFEDNFEFRILIFRFEFEFNEFRKWNDCLLELFDSWDGCFLGEYRFLLEFVNILVNLVRKNFIFSVFIDVFTFVWCFWYEYLEEFEEVLYRLWWESFSDLRGIDFWFIKVFFCFCWIFCVVL